jgi:deoxyribodipyrimidine photolyase
LFRRDLLLENNNELYEALQNSDGFYLVDYEFSSNNGNWQGAAGSGCDSAPYFGIFNPSEQVKKFDRN